MHAELTLRPIEGENELRSLHRLIATIFIGNGDLPRTFEQFHAGMSELPDLPRDGRRGIFLGDELVCGCLVRQRKIRLGQGFLPVACIGAVFTHPDHRGQGLAGRLMTEVIGYSLQHGDALLLLNGINGFYDRFGFSSIHDWTQITIRLDQILDDGPPAVSIRPATVEDAADMQTRYNDHFGAYSGSFERSLARQRHMLGGHQPYSHFCLASNDDGTTGHIKYHGRDPAASSEVSADDPQTALALLRHHADAVRKLDDATESIHWLVPPDSELASWLADRVYVDVHTLIKSNGGWMARVADPDTLADIAAPKRTADTLFHIFEAFRGNLFTLCLEQDVAAAGKVEAQVDGRLGQLLGPRLAGQRED